MSSQSFECFSAFSSLPDAPGRVCGALPEKREYDALRRMSKFAELGSQTLGEVILSEAPGELGGV
eukprot:CAMPEP_0171292048 /NCGR_PEP_ID=MMETSP0790-20130122/71960_1 /TAXON_ID=2925 /ORGANISM="Alexandrium catenella, Strain OF101" /LENGTH=64 /DNA_ID=CAMNT_0011761777 /DNA_START=141 /DNA_END=332 /DNA_ORIENTATION=+